MKQTSYALLVLLAVALVGCGKKKVESVKTQTIIQETEERVSGTHPVVIEWEEVDVDGK